MDLNPKPPSFLEELGFPGSTFASDFLRSGPNQRKALRMDFRFVITFLGRINKEDQEVWMENKTFLINWIQPAYVRSLLVHDWVPAVTLSTRPLQST